MDSVKNRKLKIKRKINGRKKVPGISTFGYARKSMIEFSQAARCVRLFRDLLLSRWPGPFPTSSFIKLHQAFISLIKSDLCNDHGLRSVMFGDHELIRGFEYTCSSSEEISFQIGYEYKEKEGICMFSPVPKFRTLPEIFQQGEMKVELLPVSIDFDLRTIDYGLVQAFDYPLESDEMFMKCVVPKTFCGMILILADIQFKGSKEFRSAMAVFI